MVALLVEVGAVFCVLATACWAVWVVACGCDAELDADCTDPGASITTKSWPLVTVSPGLTSNWATLPATGEGTSTDALSDSTNNNGCSAVTSSPTLTIHSLICADSTPKSGKPKVCLPAGVDDWGADTVWAGGSFWFVAELAWLPACSDGSVASGCCVADWDAITIKSWPLVTVSPALTKNLTIFPLTGAGTSTDALSDSTNTSGCSAVTTSPSLTNHSLISAVSTPKSGNV